MSINRPELHGSRPGLIGLLGWNLAIVAHIYRNALKVSFAAGLLIAIVYLVAWMQLNALLFPQPA